MTDLREKLGRATQSSDLGEREGVSEVDVDRVGALGMAAKTTKLGAAIVRWIGAGHAESQLIVLEQLVLALEGKYGKGDADMILHVAMQACREFADWGCTECQGRGELKSGTGVTFKCPTCGGTKLRRYRDHERADSMRMSIADYRNKAESRLAWALDVLHMHDHEIRRASRLRLAS